MKNKNPSMILRIIAILFAGAGMTVSIFALPTFGTAIAKNFPEYAYMQYPILAGIYAAAICYFFALVQLWLLLNDIDRDSMLSGKRLKAIRFSAIVFSVLYAFCAMPIIYLAADAGDAPGLIIFGMYINLFPIGIAAVAAILERFAAKC